MNGIPIILCRLALTVGLAALSLACASSGWAPSSTASRGDAPDDASRIEKQGAAHYNLGTGHLRKGRVAFAIRELRIAENLRPRDKWTQLALAEAYRRKGLWENCEQHLMKALEVDPGFQQARLTLSALYIEVGRYAESARQAHMLFEDPTFPSPWAALTNEGWAYYKLGQLHDATKALELATQYHDGYWRAFLNLGIIEAERGNRDKAIRRFERVVALEPGPLPQAEANYRMAEIYIGMGDRERAVRHLTAAVEQRPSGPWGKRSEEYLDRLR